MLKKELLLSGLTKKKPMMRFTLESYGVAYAYNLFVTLNDGTDTEAYYSSTNRNHLGGELSKFKISFGSSDNDETCMSTENPYYDKGQTCIVYDKDLNEIARTTYLHNCGYFEVDTMPISELQYYNLITDGRCKTSRYSAPTERGKRGICTSKVQRRDKEGISGQHGHCKRQGSVCARRASNDAFKHAQRRVSLVHHRHLSGRNVCVCEWWSKLTSKEALYA